MIIPNDITPVNFTVGRQGRTIDTIILHSTYGSFWGSIAWFKNSAAQVSANYIISTDGDIRRIVNEGNTSWNSGSREWNERSISIEVTDNKLKTVTENAKFALIELVADIRRRYGIKNIKFHREIVATSCPYADIKKEWFAQAPNDPLQECLSQHTTLVTKLTAYEKKEKDWIATEQRLKDEKDQALRELQVKLDTLFANHKSLCHQKQTYYKNKLLANINSAIQATPLED